MKSTGSTSLTTHTQEVRNFIGIINNNNITTVIIVLIKIMLDVINANYKNRCTHSLTVSISQTCVSSFSLYKGL